MLAHNNIPDVENLPLTLDNPETLSDIYIDRYR